MNYKDEFIWAATGAGVYGVTIGAPAMFGDGLGGTAALVVGAVTAIEAGGALSKTDLNKNDNFPACLFGWIGAAAVASALGVGEAADEPKISVVEPAPIETFSVAELKEPIAMIGDQPFFALD